jgi:hypothetical protein
MDLVDAQGSTFDLSRVKAALRIEIMRVFSLNAPFPIPGLFDRQNCRCSLAVTDVRSLHQFADL